MAEYSALSDDYKFRELPEFKDMNQYKKYH